MKKIFILFSILTYFSYINATPTKLFLLSNYTKKNNLSGYVMSEKLDGVRAFWNTKNLVTRKGKIINAPKWFLKNYPPFEIDGELWTKRNDFDTISSIARKKIGDKRWRNVTHQIFEIPNQSGGLIDRLKVLERYLIKNQNTQIRIVKQIKIKSKKHTENFLDEVVALKGEGVVARDPNVAYKTGRLKDAFKIKKYLDAECIVKKIIKGKGKFVNKMGSILCALENKIEFKIGTGFSNQDRNNPPKVGDKVNYKYYGFTKNNLPKFPVFIRIKK